jgi:hypothetical protein
VARKITFELPARLPAVCDEKETPPFADLVSHVFDWIVTGAAEHQIIASIKQYWPEQSPEPLIVAAYDRLTKSADPDRVAVHGWCVEATMMVYQRAIDVRDWQAALRAIKQIHDLTK